MYHVILLFANLFISLAIPNATKIIIGCTKCEGNDDKRSQLSEGTSEENHEETGKNYRYCLPIFYQVLVYQL